MNLNALSDYGGEKTCDVPSRVIRPSMLVNLKQQREGLQQRLAKLDDAIAALESNPEVASILEKISAL